MKFLSASILKPIVQRVSQNPIVASIIATCASGGIMACFQFVIPSTSPPKRQITDAYLIEQIEKQYAPINLCEYVIKNHSEYAPPDGTYPFTIRLEFAKGFNSKDVNITIDDKHNITNIDLYPSELKDIMRDVPYIREETNRRLNIPELLHFDMGQYSTVHSTDMTFPHTVNVPFVSGNTTKVVELSFNSNLEIARAIPKWKQNHDVVEPGPENEQDQQEKERIAREKEAEKKRLAEIERIAREKEAEKERLAEIERIAREKEAEKERLAEIERIAREKERIQQANMQQAKNLVDQLFNATNTGSIDGQLNCYDSTVMPYFDKYKMSRNQIHSDLCQWKNKFSYYKMNMLEWRVSPSPRGESYYDVYATVAIYWTLRSSNRKGQGRFKMQYTVSTQTHPKIVSATTSKA